MQLPLDQKLVIASVVDTVEHSSDEPVNALNVKSFDSKVHLCMTLSYISQVSLVPRPISG